MDTLDNDRVVVANPAPPAVANLDLVEELRLGSALAEVSDVFGDVGSLAAHDDGTIYVADFVTREVSEFSPGGAFRRVVLRQGEGPGELGFRLGAVDLLWQAPDRLWIGDPPGLMVLDSSGGLRRTSLDLGLSRWPARSDTLGLVYREASGLTNEASRAWIEAYRVSAPHTLTRFGDAFPLELVELRARVYRRGRSEAHQMFDLPMRSRVVWDVDPSGDLWVARGGVYRIHRVTLEGDTVRTVEVPLRPEPLQGEERRRAAEDSPFEADELPGHKPLLADLRVDRTGWLWVRREGGTSSPSMIDVFDQCGRQLGSARSNLADHEPWLVLGAARLLGVVRDELEVEYVVRLRLENQDGTPLTPTICTF